MERRFERADTAYSPRFREEEHSAATEQIMAYFPKCDYGADEIVPYKTRVVNLSDLSGDTPHTYNDPSHHATLTR